MSQVEQEFSRDNQEMEEEEELKNDYQNFGTNEQDEQQQQQNEEDPYQNDEQTYQEHFRKTFITENQKKMVKQEQKQTWTLHDMLIPAGKTAKLIRIRNPQDQDFRISEVCDKLKFVNGKALAGICRAAFRTDAVIIDSGIGSGIEKFCLRKNVNLIGVCPEKEVIYPRINPAQRRDNELTNGHTHFFLIGDESKKYDWGDETSLKFDLAQRLANGRSKFAGNKNGCKIVTVLLGDNPYCYKDIEMSLNKGIPIVVLEGSNMTNDILQLREELGTQHQELSEERINESKQRVMERVAKSNFVRCKESSEDLASIVHLLLAVTLF